MVNPEDHITPDEIAKELAKVSDELKARATKRLRAAIDGLFIVRSRTKYHMMLGHGAIRTLCNKPPGIIVRRLSHKICDAICDQCASKYHCLILKAIRIETGKL